MTLLRHGSAARVVLCKTNFPGSLFSSAFECRTIAPEGKNGEHFFVSIYLAPEEVEAEFGDVISDSVMDTSIDSEMAFA